MISIRSFLLCMIIGLVLMLGVSQARPHTGVSLVEDQSRVASAVSVASTTECGEKDECESEESSKESSEESSECSEEEECDEESSEERSEESSEKKKAEKCCPGTTYCCPSQYECHEVKCGKSDPTGGFNCVRAGEKGVIKSSLLELETYCKNKKFVQKLHKKGHQTLHHSKK